MKLRNKILAFVAPTAAMAAITPIALTSCKNNGENGPTTITYSGSSKGISITSDSYTLEFSLDKELPQYWTLMCGMRNLSGKVQTAPKADGITTSGKKVRITFGASSIKPLQPMSKGDSSTFDLAITCRNSSFKDVWVVNITGFTVTYQGA